MSLSCQLYKSSFIDFIGGGSKGGMQSISPLNCNNVSGGSKYTNHRLFLPQEYPFPRIGIP